MNTVRSFWLGWGSLCVAGGGAYVFARKSINADRAARLEEQRKKKSMIERPEYVPELQIETTNLHHAESTTMNNNGRAVRTDIARPQLQARRSTPSPTNHGPAT